jgi:hypothetical protein
MFKFFAAIASFISTIVDFVVQFFVSLITVITRTVEALAYVLIAVAWLPTYVKVYVLAMIGVSVLLFFINKGSD